MAVLIHESVLQGRENGKVVIGGRPRKSGRELCRGRGSREEDRGPFVCKVVLSRCCPAKLEAGLWNPAIWRARLAALRPCSLTAHVLRKADMTTAGWAKDGAELRGDEVLPLASFACCCAVAREPLQLHRLR